MEETQSSFNSDAFPPHLRILMVGDNAALWAAGGALAYLEELGLLKPVLSRVRILSCDEIAPGELIVVLCFKLRSRNNLKRSYGT